jgi:hypothetical protein
MSITKKPVSFNIYLDTNLSDSIGPESNKRFPINLSDVVKFQDFSKSYKVYFTMESTTSGSSSISALLIYLVDVTIGNNFSISKSNIPNIGPEYILYTNVLGGDRFLNTKYDFNPPIILKSLYGVDYINIQIRRLDNANISGSYISRNQYHLHFEEIVD